jgi:hypothetical protein
MKRVERDLHKWVWFAVIAYTALMTLVAYALIL